MRVQMRSWIRRIGIGVMLTTSLGVLPSLAQSSDPMLGTWRLNVAKSSWTPGSGPKSQSRVYEARPGGIMLISLDTVAADGSRAHSVIAAKYDGREYPIVAADGSTGAPTAISDTRVDARTVQYTTKQGTRTTSTATKSVSADGKTMTHTVKGTNAQGQSTANTLVFEKQ